MKIPDLYIGECAACGHLYKGEMNVIVIDNAEARLYCPDCLKRWEIWEADWKTRGGKPYKPHWYDIWTVRLRRWLMRKYCRPIPAGIVKVPTVDELKKHVMSEMGNFFGVDRGA